MDESEFENFGAMSDEDDALAYSGEAVPCVPPPPRTPPACRLTRIVGRLPPMPGLVRRPNVPVPRLQVGPRRPSFSLFDG